MKSTCRNFASQPDVWLYPIYIREIDDRVSRTPHRPLRRPPHFFLNISNLASRSLRFKPYTLYTRGPASQRHRPSRATGRGATVGIGLDAI